MPEAAEKTVNGAAEASTENKVDATVAGDAADDGDQGVEDTVFNVTVELPGVGEDQSFQIMVAPHEQIQDIRQSIIEQPIALQHSCFHLEHNGEPINDFVQVSDIKDIGPESKIKLVEDPYTEKDARIHLVRVRELIGAAGDRTDSVQGILSGLSLYDHVSAQAREASEAPAEYDFTAPADLTTLLPQESEPAPKTVKAIQLSPWNPPPAHLRQKGHLLYLIVTTNEGEQHQITSHVGGFFVNKSSNAKFDPFPRPAPKAHSAHSLLTLIEQISPSFAESFKQLQEHSNQRELLSTFQITSAIPAAPWLVPPQTSPACSHVPDITRSQETFLIAGADNTDTLRDWNEELQSARELPKEGVQDRVFRERMIAKVFADYTDAAARGAVLVARGEVAPLNPTEEHDAQIFIYNNVFFSFAADGVHTFTSEGGDEAAKVATGKDVLGVRLVNQLDIEGLYTPGTIVVDYLGKRIVGQSIVPGIFKQREPGENQIDYGAVDGKDVVAADEKFVPVFQKLSQALKVKKHPVWDKEGKRFDLEGSVETKGLLGTDGRKYVLDMYRITPLDISWLEDESEGPAYPHRMTVLRPELIESFSRHKLREWIGAELAKRGQNPKKSDNEKSASDKSDESKDEAEKKEASADAEESKDDSEAKKNPIDPADFKFSLNPDVFSGQVPQTDEEKEAMAADEKDVKAACEFLRETAIPQLLKDLKESESSFPMDGRSLSEMLHKRGINLRYIGKVASLCDGSRLQCLKDVCLREIVARSFKHVAAGYLRRLPLPLTSACIAHLLNCLLGKGLNPKPAADVDPSIRSLYDSADLAFENVTPDSLKEAIQAEALQRFRFALPAEWTAEVPHQQLLREVCLKLGIQLQSKQFAFNAEPAEPKQETKTNGASGQTNSEAKKKKKKARDGSPSSVTSSASQPHTFSPDDFVNVVPVVKDSSSRSSLAEEALEAGRLSIAQNQKKLGQDLLLESLSLHEQIYGILHPEVARVYHTLSMLYFQLDEKDAAVELARKAIIVSERTVGVDTQETLLDYLNLSLFLHQQNESALALEYTKHALSLWKIIYGPDHPDTITTMNNAAVMLQHTKAYHESRRWFEESLRVCERVFGRSSVNSATLLFQLAQALALDNDSKAAVNTMRESYSIFLAELGAEDKNTKEAESWLEQLTQNAVNIAKHAKDQQARRLRAGIRFTPRSGALGSTAAAAARVASGAADAVTSSAVKTPATDSRSIEDLIRYIEGTDNKKKGGASGDNKKRGGGRANPKRRGASTA